MQNSAKTAFWEHFPHEADMGIRGVGATKEQAFEQAAMALMAVITEPSNVELKEKIEISCEAADDEMLLIDWLSNIIFEMSSRKMLFGRFEVKIDKAKLSAICWGERADAVKHRPAAEVKGASYTELKVKQTDDGRWVAQCVVDV